MNKPEILYRGIVLDFDKIKNWNFDADIDLPKDFIYDENGNKLVVDGNEYGIYMSDNVQMPIEAYGKSSVFDGTTIDETLKFGARKKIV